MSHIKSVLLVDGSYMLHRNLNQGELWALKNDEGKHTGGVFGILRSLRKQMREVSYDRVMFFIDRFRADWRYGHFPEYKGNREYNETPDEHTGLTYLDVYNQQVDILKELLPQMNVRVVHWGEADDLIYLSAKRHLEEDPEVFVDVLSDDGDFGQFVSLEPKRLRVILPIKGLIYTGDNFFDHHQLSPEWYVINKCLEGDGGDNIPGVGTGLGWQTHLTFCNRLRDVGLTPSEVTGQKIFDAVQDWDTWWPAGGYPGQKWRTRNYTQESIKIFDRNRELIDLSRYPRPHREDEMYDSVMAQKPSFNQGNLVVMFRNLGFKSLADMVLKSDFKVLS